MFIQTKCSFWLGLRQELISFPAGVQQTSSSQGAAASLNRCDQFFFSPEVNDYSWITAWRVRFFFFAAASTSGSFLLRHG